MTDTTNKKVTKTATKKTPAPVVAPAPAPVYCRATQRNIALWKLDIIDRALEHVNELGHEAVFKQCAEVIALSEQDVWEKYLN